MRWRVASLLFLLFLWGWSGHTAMTRPGVDGAEIAFFILAVAITVFTTKERNRVND